jgi:uncharacterized damage-inducible protein DinB
MKFSKIFLFLSLTLLLSARIFSADKPVSPDKGIRAEIIQELNDAEEKISSLAKDIPEAKYSWRPDEGVRSVSEVLMHVSGGNYFFLSFTGFKMPEGMTEDGEKNVTDKKQIAEFIAKAYANARDKIMAVKDKDLEKMVDFFGNKITTRQLLLKMVNHSHEHLGQLIAYARMNGITPSWSKKAN